MSQENIISINTKFSSGEKATNWDWEWYNIFIYLLNVQKMNKLHVLLYQYLSVAATGIKLSPLVHTVNIHTPMYHPSLTIRTMSNSNNACMNSFNFSLIASGPALKKQTQQDRHRELVEVKCIVCSCLDLNKYCSSLDLTNYCSCLDLNKYLF